MKAKDNSMHLALEQAGRELVIHIAPNDPSPDLTIGRGTVLPSSPNFSQ